MIHFKIDLPSPEVFAAFRADTSWGVPDPNSVKAALAGSLCGVLAFEDADIVGIARVVGDGALNLYVQDVIIRADRRGQGIGDDMLRFLIMHLAKAYPSEATIGLMAAAGQVAFYEKLGFTARPNHAYGAGMCASLQSLANTAQSA